MDGARPLLLAHGRSRPLGRQDRHAHRPYRSWSPWDLARGGNHGSRACRHGGQEGRFEGGAVEGGEWFAEKSGELTNLEPVDASMLRSVISTDHPPRSHGLRAHDTRGAGRAPMTKKTAQNG